MSIRTDFIFYPIDSNDFAQIIKTKGYELKEALQAIGPIRLEIPGQLADKEGNQVILDTNMQILAVDGNNPKAILSIFNELENIIKEDMKINYYDNIKFYETVIDYHVYTENNPRKVIEEASQQDKIAEAFSEILNHPVSLFTLRFASKNNLPNNPEWIDVRLEPFVRRADKVYAFNLVYRSVDGKSVKTMLESVEDTIIHLIQEIHS
jgi:hypothetical protein